MTNTPGEVVRFVSSTGHAELLYRCEYCGRGNLLRPGVCEGCGAPLPAIVATVSCGKIHLAQPRYSALLNHVDEPPMS